MGQGKPPDISIGWEPPGSDPYNRAGEPALDPSETKRRTLDDMRRLSESIKNAPRWEQPAKISPEPLFEQMARMAMLRANLERTLSEIEALSAAGVPPSDGAMARLRQQLLRATHHLEDAIDCLMPLEDEVDPAQKGPR
jgi:hypothetical protein